MHQRIHYIQIAIKCLNANSCTYIHVLIEYVVEIKKLSHSLPMNNVCLISVQYILILI